MKFKIIFLFQIIFTQFQRCTGKINIAELATWNEDDEILDIFKVQYYTGRTKGNNGKTNSLEELDENGYLHNEPKIPTIRPVGGDSIYTKNFLWVNSCSPALNCDIRTKIINAAKSGYDGIVINNSRNKENPIGMITDTSEISVGDSFPNFKIFFVGTVTTAGICVFGTDQKCKISISTPTNREISHEDMAHYKEQQDKKREETFTFHYDNENVIPTSNQYIQQQDRTSLWRKFMDINWKYWNDLLLSNPFVIKSNEDDRKINSPDWFLRIPVFLIGSAIYYFYVVAGIILIIGYLGFCSFVIYCVGIGVLKLVLSIFRQPIEDPIPAPAENAQEQVSMENQNFLNPDDIFRIFNQVLLNLRQGTPLTLDQFNNLPTLQFAIVEPAHLDNCPICQEILNVAVDLIKLSCNHILHRTCAQQLFLVHLKTKCPYCRRVVVPN